MAGRRFKGVDINRSTAKLISGIEARLDEWASLKPSKYHTVEGMDALSQELSVTSVDSSSPLTHRDATVG